MGLNDSFSHAGGQILLMDHLPSITRVFSLITQEESQRTIRLSNPVTEARFAVKVNHNARKGSPRCSYCSLIGHTKDKCFKLHGYPPSYNNRNKKPHVVHTNAVIENLSQDSQHNSSLNAITNDSLTPQQCQQLIAMLSN
ncbi:hypothetical protein HRI_004570400 [Hibiscus trionum]|uniref:Uncharacterized protein n=1 Tax=Hibiscus trionum TaxID=183268 RepID=A0A9W7MQG7_HIBTR|nr:hypothetical protein HRI_004570400 [Hibiscus trionum]